MMVTACDWPGCSVPPELVTTNGAVAPLVPQLTARPPVLLMVIEPDVALAPRSSVVRDTLSTPGAGSVVAGAVAVGVAVLLVEMVLLVEVLVEG